MPAAAPPSQLTIATAIAHAYGVGKQDRKSFLGGSDAAAVMGLSPWSTPVELWLYKTGQKPESLEVDIAREKRFRRGHKLEPFIREMVIEKLQDEGFKVEVLAINRRYIDAEHRFLACEIDFELRLWGECQVGEKIYELDGVEVNADAKSVSGFARAKWGKERNTDVPIEYACQFTHGMGIRSRPCLTEVLGPDGKPVLVDGKPVLEPVEPRERKLCLVAALRSFDDVDIYWCERDDDVVAAMRAKEVLFWNCHVLTGIPPDPVNFDDIKLLFPVDNGNRKEATPEIAAKINTLRVLKLNMSADEQSEKDLTFEIGKFIEPASEVLFEGKVIATFKAQGDTRLDSKKLKLELPEVFDAYAKSKTIRVLRLPKDPKPPKN